MEELLLFQLNESTSIKVTIIDSEDELSCSSEANDVFTKENDNATDTNKLVIGSKRVHKVHKEISDKALLNKIRQHTNKLKSTSTKNMNKSPVLRSDEADSNFLEKNDSRLQNVIDNAVTKSVIPEDTTTQISTTPKPEISCKIERPTTITNIKDVVQYIDDFKSNSIINENIYARKKVTPRRDNMTISSGKQIEDNPIANVSTVEEEQNCHEKSDTLFKNIDQKRDTNELKTIAENVLCILPSLYNYMTLRDRKPYDEKCVLEAKYKFQKISKEYFLLSYSNTLTTIIPHKNDPEFLKRFYNLILELTNPTDYVFTAKNVHGICSDLIRWTESMQKFQNFQRKRIYTKNTTDTTRPPNTMANSHENLTALLNNPTKISHEDLEGKKQKYGRRSLLFSAGPPGREIEIKTLTDGLNQHVRDNDVSAIQTPTNQLPNYFQEVHSNFNNGRASSAFSLNAQTNIPTFHAKVHATNLTQEPTVSQQNCIQSSVFTHSLSNNMRQTRRPEPPPYPYQNIKYGNTTGLQKPTPDYLQQLAKNTGASGHTILLEERSSVSRDSGFMSPNIEDILDELESVVAAAPAEPGTPVISRVTSMHPGVARAPYRPCVVCCATTNMSCMGCNLAFYCSERCQAANWPYHRDRCMLNGK